MPALSSYTLSQFHNEEDTTGIIQVGHFHLRDVVFLDSCPTVRISLIGVPLEISRGLGFIRFD